MKRSPAEWALKYVADFPEVFTVLSGMSTLEQVEENFEIFSNAKPNSLTEEEQALIREVALEYTTLIKAGCTNCRYCMPCPQEIDIPLVIDYYNQWYRYHAYRTLRQDYEMDAPAKKAPQTASLAGNVNRNALKSCLCRISCRKPQESMKKGLFERL